MYSNGNGKAATAVPETAKITDILPHNHEAERAVIGSILIDPDAFFLVDTIIKPADFYSEAHGKIYRAISDLYASKVAIDVLTVIETLRKRGLEGCHGHDIDTYVIEMLNVVPTAINAPDYARIIESNALRRRLILAGREISALGVMGDSPAQLVEQSEKALFKVTQQMATVNVLSNREAMSNLMDITQARINRGDHDPGVKTGLIDVDKILGGMKGKDLIILAGRPGMGKSMLEGQIAVHCATNHGPVARFNLEMGSESLAQRMVSADSGIPFRQIERAQMNAEETRRFHESVGRLSILPIFTDDSAGLTMSQLTAKARRLHAEHGLKLVTIDYLQLMAVDNSYGNRVQDVGQISRGLKGLAKELDVPVLALAQLSRSCEARGDKRPLLSDLRDSGEIEQDADVVMFIYRDDYYNPDTSDYKNAAELNIAKHRNGETGMAMLHVKKSIMKFGNRISEEINL